MLDLESLGYFADGSGMIVRKALYGEHQLVLLWIQTILTRNLFACAQEAADLVAKFCSSPVILETDVLFWRHAYFPPFMF